VALFSGCGNAARSMSINPACAIATTRLPISSRSSSSVESGLNPPVAAYEATRHLIRCQLMKARRASAIAAALLAPFISLAFADDPIRPDPKLTPGDTLPVTTDEICEPGYSKFVRRYIDGRTKAEVYREYGLENHQPGTYEIDHLIAIALGGSNDIKNLWPQTLDDTKPWNAKLKDRLERRLHQLVCIDHALSLHDAQEAIASDWIAAYRKYVGER
jgi:hypothetical protein